MLVQGMGVKRPSKYVFRVLEWIVLQSFLNRYEPITIQPEVLALRLDLHKKYWMAGKIKTALAHIETGFQLAKHMEYISNFNTTGGKNHSSYSFKPNKAKLYPGSVNTQIEKAKTAGYNYIPSQLDLKTMINT